MQKGFLFLSAAQFCWPPLSGLDRLDLSGESPSKHLSWCSSSSDVMKVPSCSSPTSDTATALAADSHNGAYGSWRWGGRNDL